MLLDVINLDKVRRGILYTLIMFLVLAAQEIVLSRITIFGVRAMIVPIFPVAVGLLQGGMWGMGFGLACGILCDTMFAENLVMFTILLPCLGFLATAAERFLISRKLVAFFAASTAALAVTAIAQVMRTFLLFNAEMIPMLRVAGLQVLYSIPFIFPLYYPCRALSERALD
ncbi:MAG: hypothetical protein AB7D36_07845 [Oscillospiraceae bacterium]